MFLFSEVSVTQWYDTKISSFKVCPLTPKAQMGSSFCGFSPTTAYPYHKSQSPTPKQRTRD